MDRAATAEAAGEVRMKAAEAISGRRGSGESEAWVACCYYCTDELLERAGPQPLERADRDPPRKRKRGRENEKREREGEGCGARSGLIGRDF